MKSKYLQIEIVQGRLYIYVDDKDWVNSNTITRKQIDDECEIAEIPIADKDFHLHVKIPLKEFQSSDSRKNPPWVM